MSRPLPWNGSPVLAVCVSHAGDEPFRAIASTLRPEGRCVQCVAQERLVPEEQVALFGADE